MNNTEETTIKNILSLEAELGTAVLTHNALPIETILADDFYAVGHVGNVVNKKEYTEIHLAAERNFIKFETKEQSVKLIGNVAYVTGLIHVATEGIKNTSRYITIYQKIGENWKMIFWQETPITKDKF